MKSINCLPFASTWVQPRFFGGVRVAHLFSFLCCPIMCLYAMSAVLWFPLRFPHKNEVLFVLTSSCLRDGTCLVWVICVCLCIVVSTTYCVVFLFYFSSSCVPGVASFSGLPFFWLPLEYSITFIYYTYQHYCNNDSNEC